MSRNHRSPGSNPRSAPFLAVGPWASPFASASLGFPICQMGTTAEPRSQSGGEGGFTQGPWHTFILQTKIWTNISCSVVFTVYRALEGNKGLGVGMQEAADSQEEGGGGSAKAET